MSIIPVIANHLNATGLLLCQNGVNLPHGVYYRGPDGSWQFSLTTPSRPSEYKIVLMQIIHIDTK